MAARRRPLIFSLALALGLAGCAAGVPRPSGQPTPAGEPRDEAAHPAGGAEAGLSAAGSALVAQGVNERRAGDYARAAATLERALRIEPGSPAVWLELARVRLAEGDYAQAEQLARKAVALAAGQPPLAAESRAVLAEALLRRNEGS